MDDFTKNTLLGVSIGVAALIIAVTLFLGIGKLLLLIVGAFLDRHKTPEKVAADCAAYNARLLKPDWSLFERQLQRKVPQELKTLFENHTLLLKENLEYEELTDDVEIYLNVEFCALDETALKEKPSDLPSDAIPFARSHDDYIFLRPGQTEADSVYIKYHDGDETDLLAIDLRTFVKRLHSPGA